VKSHSRDDLIKHESVPIRGVHLRIADGKLMRENTAMGQRGVTGRAETYSHKRDTFYNLEVVDRGYGEHRGGTDEGRKFNVIRVWQGRLL